LKTDNRHFKGIVEQHSRQLYAHIRSILLNHDDTDDVLQNTFIKAWNGLDKFKGESELSTWLFRIATNEALQYLRKQKNQRLFLVSPETMEAQQVLSEHRYDGDDVRQKLEQAMLSLSVQQRMVFSMKYFNDLKYTEMAEILDLKEGTLKAVYHNAVKKIEKYIIDYE
jgi:RNA polymerase sigma-70 factor, ECF subfamily